LPPYTAIDLQKADCTTGANIRNLEAGINDSTAILYLRAMLNAIELTTIK